MSGGMWKPGNPRPDVNNGNPFVVLANNRKRSNSYDNNTEHVKRDNSSNTEQQTRRQRNNNDGRRKSDSLAVSGLKKEDGTNGSSGTVAVAQLSSATKNMRFMQRKNQNQTATSYVRSTPTTTTKSSSSSPRDARNNSMEVDHVDTTHHSKSTGRNINDNDTSLADQEMSDVVMTTTTTPQQNHDMPPPDRVVRNNDSQLIITQYNPLLASSHATPADMYGSYGNVIGRRSFGGFNKFVAENWFVSSSAAAAEVDELSGTKSKSSRRIDNINSKINMSDSELINRAFNRNNNNTDSRKKRSMDYHDGTDKNKANSTTKKKQISNSDNK